MTTLQQLGLLNDIPCSFTQAVRQNSFAYEPHPPLDLFSRLPRQFFLTDFTSFYDVLTQPFVFDQSSFETLFSFFVHHASQVLEFLPNKNNEPTICLMSFYRSNYSDREGMRDRDGSRPVHPVNGVPYPAKVAELKEMQQQNRSNNNKSFVIQTESFQVQTLHLTLRQKLVWLLCVLFDPSFSLVVNGITNDTANSGFYPRPTFDYEFSTRYIHIPSSLAPLITVLQLHKDPEAVVHCGLWKWFIDRREAQDHWSWYCPISCFLTHTTAHINATHNTYRWSKQHVFCALVFVVTHYLDTTPTEQQSFSLLLKELIYYLFYDQLPQLSDKNGNHNIKFLALQLLHDLYKLNQPVFSQYYAKYTSAVNMIGVFPKPVKGPSFEATASNLRSCRFTPLSFDGASKLFVNDVHLQYKLREYNTDKLLLLQDVFAKDVIADLHVQHNAGSFHVEDVFDVPHVAPGRYCLLFNTEELQEELYRRMTLLQPQSIPIPMLFWSFLKPDLKDSLRVLFTFLGIPFPQLSEYDWGVKINQLMCLSRCIFKRAFGGELSVPLTPLRCLRVFVMLFFRVELEARDTCGEERIILSNQAELVLHAVDVPNEKFWQKCAANSEKPDKREAVLEMIEMMVVKLPMPVEQVDQITVKLQQHGAPVLSVSEPGSHIAACPVQRTWYSLDSPSPEQFSYQGLMLLMGWMFGYYKECTPQDASFKVRNTFFKDWIRCLPAGLTPSVLLVPRMQANHAVRPSALSIYASVFPDNSHWNNHNNNQTPIITPSKLHHYTEALFPLEIKTLIQTHNEWKQIKERLNVNINTSSTTAPEFIRSLREANEMDVNGADYDSDPETEEQLPTVKYQTTTHEAFKEARKTPEQRRKEQERVEEQRRIAREERESRAAVQIQWGGEV